jgi:hypothetical protein
VLHCRVAVGDVAGGRLSSLRRKFDDDEDFEDEDLEDEDEFDDEELEEFEDFDEEEEKE